LEKISHRHGLAGLPEHDLFVGNATTALNAPALASPSQRGHAAPPPPGAYGTNNDGNIAAPPPPPPP